MRLHKRTANAKRSAIYDITALNRRYETVAWGSLFLWIGAVSLVPGEHSGVGWLGIGIILVGLNWARHVHRIPTNWFTITLGVTALTLGMVRLSAALLKLHIELPFFPILLIVIGVILLVRVAARRGPSS